MLFLPKYLSKNHRESTNLSDKRFECGSHFFTARQHGLVLFFLQQQVGLSFKFSLKIVNVASTRTCVSFIDEQQEEREKKGFKYKLT